MKLVRTQALAMLSMVALFLWLVPAHAAEGCAEKCDGVNVPGCEYVRCFDWTSGCYNCVFQCETQCELWICPDENPDWDCGPPY